MRYVLGFLIVMFCLGAACETAKDAAKGAGKAVVDCTKGHAADTVRELGPVMERVVLDAVNPDGRVNWAPVKEVAKEFTTEVGGCVLAHAVARIMTVVREGGAQSSDLQVNRAQLAEDFAALRVELFGGARFKTAAGEL